MTAPKVQKAPARSLAYRWPVQPQSAIKPGRGYRFAIIVPFFCCSIVGFDKAEVCRSAELLMRYAVGQLGNACFYITNKIPALITGESRSGGGVVGYIVPCPG